MKKAPLQTTTLVKLHWYDNEYDVREDENLDGLVV